MQRRLSFLLILMAGLCACSPSAPAVPESDTPDEILFEVEPPVRPPTLPEAVVETRQQLLDIAERNSIRRLARKADEEPVFLSNLGGDDHYRHWDLMRRTGFDPNTQLIELLNEPYGIRLVGSETWYIWPDLAARPAGALAPERLSFHDAARLKELVGEQGLAQIEAGQSYPGVRTAISESGAWRYFLHETPS
ncbi:MAG: hypothetical protein AAF829_04350 [Pseudomonadota bacterium]